MKEHIEMEISEPVRENTFCLPQVRPEGQEREDEFKF